VRLRPRPPGRPPRSASLAALVCTQVQLLRSLLGTIAELEAAIATRVACHPHAKLLAALPGVATINLAQLPAEVGPILDRVTSAEHAARRARRGAADHGLRQDQRVSFRWAANRRAARR
jgi:hypothetical protein